MNHDNRCNACECTKSCKRRQECDAITKVYYNKLADSIGLMTISKSRLEIEYIAVDDGKPVHMVFYYPATIEYMLKLYQSPYFMELGEL